jgi:hypothetical protein
MMVIGFVSIAFLARSQPWKIDYYLRHACPDFPSVRPPTDMEQHGSHWKDFHEI